jgi:hypothetical protein
VRRRWCGRSEVIVVTDLEHPVAFFLVRHRIVGRDEGELRAVGAPRVLLYPARGIGDPPRFAAARRQDADLPLGAPLARGVGKEGQLRAVRRPVRCSHSSAVIGELALLAGGAFNDNEIAVVPVLLHVRSGDDDGDRSERPASTT